MILMKKSNLRKHGQVRSHPLQVKEKSRPSVAGLHHTSC